jgi:hypothetical protein
MWLLLNIAALPISAALLDGADSPVLEHYRGERPFVQLKLV